MPVKIYSHLTIGLLLALGLLAAPWSLTYAAPAQPGDPCLCIASIGDECTDDLSDAGHYDPRLPDPPPAELVERPPAHDFAVYLQGLFRIEQEAELMQLSVTADSHSTENATEGWSLTARATSEAITPEQEAVASVCEQSLPVAPVDSSSAVPMFSTRLRALAEDVGLSIVAILDM